MILRRLRRSLSLAESPIGIGLARPVAIVMCIVGSLVVAHDLQLLGDFSYWGGRRDVPPAIALALFVYLARHQLEAIGVRGRPLPSLKFWLWAAFGLAAIMALLIAGTIAVFLAMGWPMHALPPSRFDIFNAVVEAPLVEESIYRWLFVTGIVAALPRARWVAVVLCGAVFAYLHFVYGNPGPDNFIGGYLFAWMYLKSGSILVPMAFHAAANGTLIVLHAVAFYLF